MSAREIYMREREEKGSEESGDNLSGEKRMCTRTRTLKGGPVLRVSPFADVWMFQTGPGPR